MQAFDHHTPKTLPEALALLAQHNGKAHVIAGGTDLILCMKSGKAEPETIVNIKKLQPLQGISATNAGDLRLGALVTLRELTRSPLVLESYPSVAHAAGFMASEQIRSFATVGGNLCNASPSADLAPPLIARSASAHIVSADGEREIPLEDFFRGPGESALHAGELLQAINIPPPKGNAVYIKHAPRAFMDIAVVGVAARLELAAGRCRTASILLGAVAPTPLRARQAEAALAGQSLTDDIIANAARIASEECAPIDDIRGSAWYRRRMVGVLPRRALTALSNAQPLHAR